MQTPSCPKVQTTSSFRTWGERGRVWGHFDVCLSGKHPLFRIIEFLLNWRSRLTGIATGDQGIFVKREAFQRVGGFPEIDLMEDISLSKTLKRDWPSSVSLAKGRDFQPPLGKKRDHPDGSAHVVPPSGLLLGG